MMTNPGRGQDDAGGCDRLKLAAASAIVGVAAAIVFVGWPGLDIAASRLFYLGKYGHFWLIGSESGDNFRSLFTALTWAASLAAVAGIVLAIAARRRFLGLGLPQWLFLATVLVLGPGLIANAVLKDHWARPRPTQIVEFGGAQPFTPVLERSGQCDRNCSFVSGEASSIFALGFALALLARRRRAMLMGAAVLAGSLIGFIRIGEGGHFLSDVVFAGVLMGLAVAFLHWIVFALLRGRLEEVAPWRDGAVAGARRLRASATRFGGTAADWARRHYPIALGDFFSGPRGDDPD